MAHGFVNVEDPHGRWWRHVRAHRWWGDTERGRGRLAVHAGAELCHGHDKILNRFRLKVSTTGEETLDVAYAVPFLFRHYWSLVVDRPVRAGIVGSRQVRLPRLRFDIEVGLTGAGWCFGPDDGSWAKNASWRERVRRNRLTWFRIHQHRRSDERIKTVDAFVPLPEGPAPIKVELHRSVWALQVGPYSRSRRSRSRGVRFYVPGWRRIRWVAEWESVEGLPVPGKGENSWDCGPDAFYAGGVSVSPAQAESRNEWVAAAVASALATTLRDRARYGAGIVDTGR